MNRKILTSAIVMMICLMIIVPINKSAVSQERTRDGWGIVTDQNDNPVEDGVEVKFYQLYGPNNERRKYYKSEWTSTHAEMKGYYPICEKTQFT
jgi:hypothetical protein